MERGNKYCFQLWEMGERVGISRMSLINDVDYWYEHRKEMDQLPTRENKRKISSGMAQRMLNKAMKKRR